MKQKKFQHQEIKSLNEKNLENQDMDEDELITVFSSNNAGLFQVAKSVLDKNRIKFFPSGDYLNTLNSAVYSAELKVRGKDEKAAKEILNELAPASTQYTPSNKFDKKIQSFVVRWGILIIILSIILMIAIFYLLKQQ